MFKIELTSVRRVVRMRKRRIDSVKEILGYRGVTVEQSKEFVYDECMEGFVRGVLGALCPETNPDDEMPRHAAHPCYDVH